MENYCLLLTEENRIPVTQVAPQMGRILDRTPNEVTRRLRESPWILAEDVPPETLDPLFEILTSAGMKVKAVPSVHMPVLPRPLRVRNADVMAGGFFLQAAEQPAPPFLPWDALWIVSAGYVAVAPDEFHPMSFSEEFGAPLGSDLTARGPTPGSVPLSSGRKKPQDHMLVDFLFRGDPEWRLRIDGGDFDYDFLKEEMRTSSRENLKALLLLVREQASHSLFTARTLGFLGGEPSTSFRFRSLFAFESHNRWIVQAAQEAEESE